MYFVASLFGFAPIYEYKKGATLEDIEFEEGRQGFAFVFEDGPQFILQMVNSLLIG